jgi:RNA polymerase sigma factor (sigma-70 family)
MSLKPTTDLRELLRNYASGTNRETSFRKIADHLSGLIYHSAYRQSGDAGMAEDVTQNVLLQLSQKAGKLVRHPEILGWVHEATRLEVLQMQRAGGRRKKREETAMNNMKTDSSSDPHLLVDLDDSLRILSSSERELVLMRFFEGRTFLAISNETGRSETAEKKRLKKALEKMAGWFGKKGITLSVAGLTTVLSTEMGKAAPVGLVAGLTGSGVAGAGSGKVAAGVALLVVAGMAVPILSKWEKVRGLEARYEELRRHGEAGLSSRKSIGAFSGRVRSATVIKELDREMEAVKSVDEIAGRLIKNSFYGEIMENRKLKRQLELLDLEELRAVGLAVNASQHRKHFENAILIAEEVRSRLSAPESIIFMNSIGAHTAGVETLFANWSEGVGMEEAGKWLVEMTGDPGIQGKGWYCDTQSALWGVYRMRRADHPDTEIQTGEEEGQ